MGSEAGMNLQIPFVRGADLSSLLDVEAHGGIFRDNHGKPGDAMAILRDYGVNMVRLRLWNDPYDDRHQPYGAGTNDLPRTMALARRAKDLGMNWMLDFHYSDFWADPGKQTIPKAWQGLTETEMAEALYRFTRDTLEALAKAGLAPDWVAVGNEITNGLLWPLGKAPNFSAIVRFVNAGMQAVRDAVPETKTMIHLDQGGRNDLYRNWFDHYFDCGGADFTCIGLSYYPYWHGPMDGLRENLADLALRYQKPLLVVETSSGFSLEDYGRRENLAPDQRKGMAVTEKLAAKGEYPISQNGQRDFLRDLLQTVHNVPNQLGCGVAWWEPAWIPVPGVGWASEAALEYIQEKGPGGNEWANQALFDYDGTPNEAMQVLLEDARQHP